MKWPYAVWAMVQGSTRPLREISTRNISWRVKGGRWAGLLLPSRADCLELRQLHPWCPKGPSRPV